jgi:hypothetical protein
MRILCYILVVLFATTSAVGQQINPVPDYIFRNSMSVGRNAPTDTSAYFSIGPRFGATRGFMPPMVVDTAAVTGTKRNGLLIYSIQRNSFLYWDSTGMRWSRIAANLDTLLLSTRAWRQKGDDSLAARINTRTDTLLISTRAWRQKGIDSLASVRIGGSGVTGYIPKFTAARTIDSSQIFQQGGNIGIGTAAPLMRLHVENSTNDVLYLRNTTTTGAANTGANITFAGHAGSGFFDLGIILAAKENSTGGNTATYMSFATRPHPGSVTERMRITSAGRMGLGTTTPSGILHINSDVTGSGTPSFFMTRTGVSSDSAFFKVSNTTNQAGQFLPEFLLRSNYLSADQRIGGFISAEIKSPTSSSIGLVLNAYDYQTGGGSALGSGWLVAFRSYATDYVRIANNGNMVLQNGGTFTDAGYRLDVQGSMRNTTDAYFNTTSGETYIGTTSDAGAFKLQVNGVARASDGLATGNPNGGTAATWKLGIVVAGSYTAASNYLQVDVGGTLYYIGLVTPN